MASKSRQNVVHRNEEIEDSLDQLDKLVDRLKVLYEQYFMGIQKVAPSHLHTDAERRIRDIAQLNIRNTALRYRFATLQQKFGSYNSYWKRTLRSIEQGRYIRDLSRVQRSAQASGDDVPDEILAKMPKLMRQRVLKDRERARAKAEREGSLPTETATAPQSPSGEAQSAPTATAKAANQRPKDGIHKLDEGLLDGVDFDDLFSSIMDDAVAAVDSLSPPKPAPPRPAPSKPVAVSPPVAARPSAPPRSPAPPMTARGSTPPPIPRAAAAPPAPAAASSASRGLPPGMNEAETRKLYDKFVSARKMVGDKSDVSYDALVRTINNQAPRIMTEHKAKGVQFDVVVKGDKVILKAKPQR